MDANLSSVQQPQKGSPPEKKRSTRKEKQRDERRQQMHTDQAGRVLLFRGSLVRGNRTSRRFTDTFSSHLTNTIGRARATMTCGGLWASIRQNLLNQSFKDSVPAFLSSHPVDERTPFPLLPLAGGTSRALLVGLEPPAGRTVAGASRPSPPSGGWRADAASVQVRASASPGGLAVGSNRENVTRIQRLLLELGWDGSAIMTATDPGAVLLEGARTRGNAHGRAVAAWQWSDGADCNEDADEDDEEPPPRPHVALSDIAHQWASNNVQADLESIRVAVGHITTSIPENCVVLIVVLGNAALPDTHATLLEDDEIHQKLEDAWVPPSSSLVLVSDQCPRDLRLQRLPHNLHGMEEEGSDEEDDGDGAMEDCGGGRDGMISMYRSGRREVPVAQAEDDSEEDGWEVGDRASPTPAQQQPEAGRKRGIKESMLRLIPGRGKRGERGADDAPQQQAHTRPPRRRADDEDKDMWEAQSLGYSK